MVKTRFFLWYDRAGIGTVYAAMCNVVVGLEEVWESVDGEVGKRGRVNKYGPGRGVDVVVVVVCHFDKST